MQQAARNSSTRAGWATGVHVLRHRNSGTAMLVKAQMQLEVDLVGQRPGDCGFCSRLGRRHAGQTLPLRLLQQQPTIAAARCSHF